MSIIKSLVIAFSMYSKIPMPHLELDEKDMKYVMGFFPLIGLITGALAYGWIYAGEILYVPDKQDFGTYYTAGYYNRGNPC